MRISELHESVNFKNSKLFMYDMRHYIECKVIIFIYWNPLLYSDQFLETL